MALRWVEQGLGWVRAAASSNGSYVSYASDVDGELRVVADVDFVEPDYG